MSGKPPPLPLKYRLRYGKKSIPLAILVPLITVAGAAVAFWSNRNIFPEHYLKLQTPETATPIPREEFKYTVDVDLGFCTMRGRAKTMEDRAWILETRRQAFLGIVDGKNGTQVADATSGTLQTSIMGSLKLEGTGKLLKPENWLVAAGASVNKVLDTFPGGELEGEAAAAVLCHDKNEMSLVTVGNITTVVSRARRPVLMSLHHNLDHNPKDAFNNPGGLWSYLFAQGGRAGKLKGYEEFVKTVTRFYGDKKGRVDPDITKWTICREDDFVVTASSGVWNMMQPWEVVDYLQGLRLLNPTLSANYLARSLIHRAHALGSPDNLSAVVVTFKHNDEEREKQDERGWRLSPGRMIIRDVMNSHKDVELR